MTNSDKNIVYDYAIVGAGAAGLHLALAIIDDPYFDTKKLLIIEKSRKDTNDKTWCFWEKGMGKWDSIVSQSWNKASFITSKTNSDLNLGDYTYKMVKAIDFYTMAKEKLKETPGVTWVGQEVLQITQEEPVLIATPNETFKAKHVFDSMIPTDFTENKGEHINLLQHFKGWVIETKEDVFDPNSFVMMDFRIKYPDSTSFTYILPESSKKALIEFTFFSPALVSDNEYNTYLKEYIETILQTYDYKIVDTEKGIIPMTSYPFYKLNNSQVTKIGTAGSWVKGSSGYSFKNAERLSKKIVENIKKGLMHSKDLFKWRFKQYDTLFLDVLYFNNHLGEQVFSDMYRKNDIGKIFAFLDEETTLLDEMKIISHFKWHPFLKALFKHLSN